MEGVKIEDCQFKHPFFVLKYKKGEVDDAFRTRSDWRIRD